jgi:dihydroorotase-like cyclic amidohydrolase
MDLVVRNARLPTGDLADIGIEAGRIAAVQPGLTADAPAYDAEG